MDLVMLVRVSSLFFPSLVRLVPTKAVTQTSVIRKNQLSEHQKFSSSTCKPR